MALDNILMAIILCVALIFATNPKLDKIKNTSVKLCLGFRCV